MAADIWSQALYDALTGDADIMEAIGTYDGAPAVFTSTPIPGDAPDLFIVSPANVRATPRETKTTRGRQIDRYVYVYGKETGSEADVEAVAEMIAQLFHRDPGALSITGRSVYIASVSGPVAAPTAEDMYGRLVIVTINTEETP